MRQRLFLPVSVVMSEPLDEPYDEPSDALEASTNEPVGERRRRVKKPPVPVLPDGTWVRIGDSCRSSTLQGQVGTVVAWGRQVDVFIRGHGGSEGAVRKINPTDLIALSEEPEFTAAETEQVTGEEAVPAHASARTRTRVRGVRSTPLGKSVTTDEVRIALQPRLGPAQRPARWRVRNLPSSRPRPRRRGRRPLGPCRRALRLAVGGAAVPRGRRKTRRSSSWAAGCLATSNPDPDPGLDPDPSL